MLPIYNPACVILGQSLKNVEGEKNLYALENMEQRNLY